MPSIADKPEVSLDRLCEFALEAQIYSECLRYYPFVLGAQPVRPIDLAAFYAAIANEGPRPVPRVVDSIERDGETIYRYEKGSPAMRRRRFAEVGGDHHPAYLQTRVEVGDQLALAHVHAVGRHPFISAPAVILTLDGSSPAASKMSATALPTGRLDDELARLNVAAVSARRRTCTARELSRLGGARRAGGGDRQGRAVGVLPVIGRFRATRARDPFPGN